MPIIDIPITKIVGAVYKLIWIPNKNSIPGYSSIVKDNWMTKK